MPTPQFTYVMGMYWQMANFLKIQLPGHHWSEIPWLHKFSLNLAQIFGTLQKCWELFNFLFTHNANIIKT